MLSSLPTEILHLIASFLDRPTLASLLRVKSLCFSTFLPPLYTSIDAISLGAPALYPPLRAPYAQHVRHLTLRPHSHEHCAAPEHATLHLRSVRLYLRPAITYPEWQLHTVLAPNSNGPVEEPECELLRNVRAERVVIAETFMDGRRVSDLQPWSDGVEDIVLFLSPEQGRLMTGKGRTRLPAPMAMAEVDLGRILGHLPRGMRKLVVVMQHPIPSERDRLTSLEVFARDLLKTPRETGLVDVFEDLDEDSGQLESLTVVLPEGVLSLGFRDYLLRTILFNSQVERTEVRVLSMLEFMAHPCYQGVMTEEQKRMWWERSQLPHYEMTIEEVGQCGSTPTQLSRSRRCRLRVVRGVTPPTALGNVLASPYSIWQAAA